MDEQISAVPITWEQACQFVKSDRLHCLMRSRSQLDTYDRWIRECLQRYHTVGDFIKHIVFGWSVQQQVTNLPTLTTATATATATISTEATAVRLQAITSTRTTNQVQIVLRQNDFPYHFHREVIHYVLWSNRDNLDDQFIENHVGGAFPRQQYDWIWFCNPPIRKSIKDVWHVHILLRNN